MKCDLEVSKFIEDLGQKQQCESWLELFSVPFIVQSLEDDNEVLGELLNGVQRFLFSLDTDKYLTDRNVECVYEFCRVLCSLKPNKPDTFLNSLQYLVSLLPDCKDMTKYTTSNVGIQVFQHHVWLLLVTAQLHISSKYLPNTLDVFYQLVNRSMEGLLHQAISRVASAKQNSTVTLVNSAKTTFVPPNQFSGCSCVVAVWQSLVVKVNEASKCHTVGDNGFWALFNKHFNHIGTETDNMSGMVWIFEQIVTIATESCPAALPVNWSPIQELAKQSCVKTQHLPQVLTSLSALSRIWSPHIVIIMTLQQHFTRSLLSRSSSLVPIISPQQYLTTIQNVLRHDISPDDTVFQSFLKFYIRSLDKIPEIKKLSLIKRVFQSDKLNTKTLSTMSGDSLQNVGLLVGTCLFVSKPGSLTAQINQLFGSQSGDVISNTASPSVLISLQIAVILVHMELQMECDLVIEQLTVMLNRLSEDYIRETESKQCQIFSTISRMLENMCCLMKCNIENANFLGSWIEMFLEEGNEQRCVKVFEFCCHVVKSCLDSDNLVATSLASIQKFVIKPTEKYIKIKADKAILFEDMIASLFADYCFLLEKHVQDESKQKQMLSNIYDIMLPQTSTNLSLSSLFVSKLLAQDKAKLLDNYEHRTANIIFLFLCEAHVSNKLCTPETTEHAAHFSLYLHNLPQLHDLDINVSKPNINLIMGTIISELVQRYENLPFSQGQVLKDFVWKMFTNFSSVLKPLMDSTDDVVIKRLYEFISNIFEKLTNLLFSPTKENSPIVEMFQTFLLARLRGKHTNTRKHIVLILPRVFAGLSKISYKSNNMFFKDIARLFDEVYPVLSSSDWKNKRNDAFLVKLFAPSLVDAPKKSAKAFRMSFMNYLCGPHCGYFNLPKDPEKLAILLYFVLRLESATSNTDLIVYEFEKLYAFLLQVLFTCERLNDKAPVDVKSQVTDIFKYFIEHTHACGTGFLTDKTQLFISQNINIVNGSSFVMRTLQRILDVGGHGIVSQVLEFLENELNGRSTDQYCLLRDNVCNQIK